MYRFTPYHPRYLDDCARMVQQTWPFEKDLINPREPLWLYRHYVLDCVNWSTHLDVLVDEEDRAQGLLFGSIERPRGPLLWRYLLTQLGIRSQLYWHILKGDLGQRSAALALHRSMRALNTRGETTERPFDSEVNLFILSPQLRGQGYGRQLMDRYVDFCKQHQLRTAFLWTTVDCSYSFYERYGFQLYQRFTFEQRNSQCQSPSEGGNSMIYFLPIEP